MKEKLKQSKGITLVALVITIIVLLILAAVSINLVLGENGILQRAQSGSEEYKRKSAQEALQLKIVAIDMDKMATEKRKATLQELADALCDDDEIEYVHAKSQVASLEHITLSSTDNLATKLKAFPYEFEINSELSIAKVDGESVITQGTDEIATEYVAFKRAIADSIEEAGGIRPDDNATSAIFREKINGIVTEVTKDATATAADIAVGKTAWVNGEEVTGTAEIPTQPQSIEFAMGSATNNGGADGYRSSIVFDSKWFVDNVQQIQVKNCNRSTSFDIRAGSRRDTPYVGCALMGGCTSSATYQEVTFSKDFDTTAYPYVYIVAQTGSTTDMAAAYIKLVF